MKKGVLFTLAVYFVPLFGYAQSSVQNLSLKQAVDFAMEHNKQLQSSQKNIDLYQQKIRETVSQGLPQVNGTLDYTTNFNYEMNFGGMKNTLKDQSNLGLSVRQLLFNGQWIVGVQSSKIAKTLAAQQVETSVLDIKESVMTSYYAVLVNDRLIKILNQNLENMNTIYEHTNNMFNAGTVEATDVDQIRITVGQLNNSLLSLKRTAEISKNLLRLQLGLDPETQINLTEPLNSFLGEGDYTTLVSQPFDINNNVEYKLMQTQEQLKEKIVGLQRWSYAPTISGFYNYNYKIIKPTLDFSPQHTAGISMAIPIFSGLQRKSLLEQAKIELEQTSINKSLLEDQLQLQENQLKFDLRNAIENYNLQKENIDVAKRVLASIQRKFELGAVSSLDLTQANNNYLSAESNYTSACMALLQAQTKLKRLHNTLEY